MPKYLINEQVTYLIEADSEDEAYTSLLEGKANIIDVRDQDLLVVGEIDA